MLPAVGLEWMMPALAYGDLVLVAAGFGSLLERSSRYPSTRSIRRQPLLAGTAALLAITLILDARSNILALEREWFRSPSVAAHEFTRVIRSLSPWLPVYHTFPRWRDLGLIADRERHLAADLLPVDLRPAGSVQMIPEQELPHSAKEVQEQLAPCVLIVPPGQGIALLKQGQEGDFHYVWEIPYEHQSLQGKRKFVLLMIQPRGT